MEERALPCGTCRRAATLKTGEDYIVGKRPSSFPLRVFCARCKRVTWVTARDFNAQPVLKLKDLDKDAQAARIKDLIGDGWQEDQARQLYDAGWSPTTLDDLPKQERTQE